MLAGDKRLVSVLRVLKSAILYGEVASGSRQEGMSQEAVIDLLQKEAKKRHDAAVIYADAGEDSKAEQELYEQSVIASYLPKQLTDQEIGVMVDNIIDNLPEKPSMQSMGKIIAAVKLQTKGAADGRTIAKLVKEKLS